MSITMSQASYADGLSIIELSPLRLVDKNDSLSQEEVTLLRGIVGQLNWLSYISRPDIAFEVSPISANIKSATMNDIVCVNKVIKKVLS